MTLTIIARALAGVPVVLLVTVVVAGDRAAPRHSAWRDPISWFAAREAPHPDLTRFAMVAVASGLAVVAIRWWRRQLVRPAALVAVLAATVAGLAVVPLQCAPRIEYCQALMRHGKVGGPHLIHAAIAAGGVMLAGGSSVVAARRDRRPWVLTAAGIAVLCGVWMLVDPTSARLGTIQWAFLIAATAATATLGRPVGSATRSSEAR